MVTINSKLRKDGTYRQTSSANVRVGDIIKINQNERVPADCVLLYTSEKTGSVFIRTDQLDGETDWKLRKACGMTQSFPDYMKLSQIDGTVVANPPNNLIYDFKGYFESSGMQPI